MSEQPIRTRMTFIEIQRPLLPPPPLDSKPYWCYTNTLIFHDAVGNNVWEQEIPESKLGWVESWHEDREADEFDKYFSCSVFKDGDFGWQLRATISHARAKKWLQKMLEYVDEHHKQHFATLLGGT